MADAQAAKPKNDEAATAGREIVITRVFDARREMIWDAWTDPKQIVKWWGPRGFTLTIHHMDVRPGGLWRSTMHAPDGAEYRNDCVFTEVVKPERIAYLTGLWTAEGDANAEVSWTFEAQGENTKLTLHLLFPTAEARDRAARTYKVMEGGNGTLDRLGELLGKRILR